MLKVRIEVIGSIEITRLKGQLVTGAIDTLQRAVSFQPGVSAMVLDLAGVNRIDARGLGVLLELREQAQLKGIEFRLMNVTKLVQQILDITRLNTVFEITSERDVQSLATSNEANDKDPLVATVEG